MMRVKCQGLNVNEVQKNALKEKAGHCYPIRARLSLVATIQGILLVFSSALMDGGEFFKILIIALAPYWLAVAFIAWKRGFRPARIDRNIIKYFYPIAVAAAFLWQWKAAA